MATTPMRMDLDFAARSDPGRVRANNEDALLCCPSSALWAVADGMGGHRCGEVASALAVQVLSESVAAGAELVAAVQAANRAILAAASRDAEGRGMGTTLVAVRFDGADFEAVWAGDSRLYRVDGQGIEQLSHDHSWVQSMIDAGEMSQAQARRHPRRNVILQCLGGEDQPLQVGRLHGRLAAHELLLLCSDGLSGELSDPQIQQACTQAHTLEELVEQLIELANQHGGRDNISCIVIGRAASASEGASRAGGILRRLARALFGSLKPSRQAIAP